MRLSGLARLALVAGVLSAGSLGTTAFWGLKVVEASEIAQRYRASLPPGWTEDADQMMAGVRARLLRTTEEREEAARATYVRVSRFTFWVHGIVGIIALVFWIGIGFRKPDQREGQS